jgi:hypothetical protein
MCFSPWIRVVTRDFKLECHLLKPDSSSHVAMISQAHSDLLKAAARLHPGNVAWVGAILDTAWRWQDNTNARNLQNYNSGNMWAPGQPE